MLDKEKINIYFKALSEIRTTNGVKFKVYMADSEDIKIFLRALENGEFDIDPIKEREKK